MTDYLRTLVSRSLNKADVVRPKLPSIFEPLRSPSEGSLFGYTPKDRMRPELEENDYKGHKNVDLPLESSAPIRARQSDLIGNGTVSEGSNLDDSPVQRPEHIDVMQKKAELWDTDLPSKLTPDENNVSRDLVKYRSGLGLEEDTKESESRKMEKIIFDHHSSFRHKESKNFVNGEQRSIEPQIISAESEREEKAIPSGETSFSNPKNIMEESGKRKSIEPKTNLEESELRERVITDRKSSFSRMENKIEESAKLIKTDPEKKSAWSPWQQNRTDWRSMVRQESIQSVKSKNSEFGSETNANVHRQNPEVNGSSEAFEFRPDIQMRKKSNPMRPQLSSMQDNEVTFIKGTGNKFGGPNKGIPSCNALVPQLKSIPPLSLYPDTDLNDGTEITPFKISSRDDLRFGLNPISQHVKAYHRAGNRTRATSQTNVNQVADNKPEVRVTIGRIEIKAVQQSPSTKPSPRSPKAPSLDEYLRKRAKGDIG